MIEISANPMHAPDLLARFERSVRSTGGTGAIVSFSGLVRDTARGENVCALRLQAYSPMTETGIADAVRAATSRWPLDRLYIQHRIGEMAPSDTIVFVATASAHRRAAFEAADFLMDYLKTEAIFWKQEVTENGATWIEPRAEDYTDATRWQQGDRV